MNEQTKKKPDEIGPTETAPTNPVEQTAPPAATVKAQLLDTTAPFDPVDPTKAAPAESAGAGSQIPAETAEELDADEEEFRKMRHDLPGVKGSSSSGIVSISVGKAPPKNEFSRTHPTFSPIVSIVVNEVGLDRHYFAVTPDMVKALAEIGISVAPHKLYLTVTSGGTLRGIPVRCQEDDSAAEDTRNEWDKTKEYGLVAAMTDWLRFYTDKANSRYQVFKAEKERFGEPRFPDLPEHKIFKLMFRARGHLIDSPEHALFKKWAARDTSNDKK